MQTLRLLIMQSILLKTKYYLHTFKLVNRNREKITKMTPLDIEQLKTRDDEKSSKINKAINIKMQAPMYKSQI